MFDCPKCVTVCKQPHCVTHCQAPKPECEPVCEEPKCDWKCHKPACPKPKCELVCENPNCVPKVECCACAMGAPAVAAPMPFFKETETNQKCCGCGGAGGNVVAESPQVTNINPAMTNTMSSSATIQTQDHLLRIEKGAQVEMLSTPVALGTGQMLGIHQPNAQEFEKYRTSMNLNMIHQDSLR
jgi:hypothetical protein